MVPRGRLEAQAPPAASETEPLAEDVSQAAVTTAPAAEVVSEVEAPAAVPAASQTEPTPATANETQDEAPAGMVFDPTTGRYMPVGEPLPWRNSFFIFDNSLSHTTLDRSTLSSTRYWIQTYSLRPRWNFNDTLSLRLRQDIYAELLADNTTSEQQPVFFDAQVDLIDASWFTVEGVIIGGGARFFVPTSLASRNANRVLSTGGIVSATKVFGEVLSGLVTQVAGGYQHWWATSTTPTSYTPGTECIDGGNVVPCSRFPTLTSVRDTFTASVFGQISITPEFTTGLAFTWLWQRGAGLDSVDLGAIGPGVSGELSDQSKTHWRNLIFSSVFIGYQVNAWLQASLGLNTFTSQLNPNGNVRNPFWNPDTQYSLTASFTLDQFYTVVLASTSSGTPPETAAAGDRSARW